MGGQQGYRATRGHHLTLIWERLQSPGCEDRPTTYKDHWKETDRNRFHSKLSIAFAGSPLRPSVESLSPMCIVHRGCGFFPREGSLARTFVQRWPRLPLGHHSPASSYLRHRKPSPVWWQLQFSIGVPRKGSGYAHAPLAVGLAQPSTAGSTFSLEGWGHGRKTNSLPATAGDSGKGCKRPRPDLQK